MQPETEDILERDAVTSDGHHRPAGDQESSAADPEKPSPVFLVVVIVIACVIGYFVYQGIDKRAVSEKQLQRDTEDASILAVSVVKPGSGMPVEHISLPANLQAYSDTPIFARTSGYLKAWHFDIGAQVKSGQLLAELEAPEVDKQLEQARAELATAEANLELARSTAERWKDLLRTNSVSRQETDEKIAGWNVQKTRHEAAASNVRRLEDLKSFQKIYAPFSGVITGRSTDIGALVVERGNQELFHLSAIHRLRVFVNVPQTYAASAKPGTMAGITLQELPGRKFQGRLVRTSSAIDPISRTLRTEFDVDNRSGELLPGSYATLDLPLSESTRVFSIPSTALLFRSEGLLAAVVKEGKAELTPITLGRDFGTTVEVVAGLSPDDLVIADPSDSLVTGMSVRVVSKGGAGE